LEKIRTTIPKSQGSIRPFIPTCFKKRQIEQKTILARNKPTR
jgi:hypothetical protein